MAASACHITTDLTKVALYDGSNATMWSPADTEGEAAETAAGYRQRAQAAAQWLSQQGSGAKRLSMVCVDTSEALCTWIQARSAAHQVVASAYRDQTQEWGADASSVAVEPILPGTHEGSTQPKRTPFGLGGSKKQETETGEADGEPATPGATGESRVSTAVITLHDALVRLWLDAMDQRGVRPGAVVSLWHALALAWTGTGGRMSAVIHINEENNLIWAWTKGGELLTGGTVAAPAHHAVYEGEEEQAEAPDPDTAAEHRLSLDWLSWGAYLGTFPESVTIISHRETTLDGALGKRFEKLSIDAQKLEDPLRETLERASRALAASSAPLNSRKCLLRLTNRPTRSVRRRYRLAAAALVLASVALIGLGVRLQRGASEATPAIAELRAEQDDLVRRVGVESVTQSRRPISALRAIIGEEQRKDPPPPPPDPPPIYEEIANIASVIAGFEDVQLGTLSLGGRATARSNELRVEMASAERRVQINFETALKESQTSLEWSRQNRSSASRSLTLSGNWVRGGE